MLSCKQKYKYYRIALTSTILKIQSRSWIIRRRKAGAWSEEEESREKEKEVEMACMVTLKICVCMYSVYV